MKHINTLFKSKRIAATSLLVLGLASLSDLAVVSGMDHEEAPVEFLVTEPESVLRKGFVE